MVAWTWVRHARFLSPFYWRRLDRAPPDHFRLTLPPLWDEPDAEDAPPAARDAASKETNARDVTALLEGTFVFFGESHRLGESDSTWLPDKSTPAWRAELHAFAWLTALRSLDTPLAHDRAREMIGRWIADHGHWHPVSWRPDVVGRRVTAWLEAAEGLLSTVGDPLSAPFLASLGRQGRYLIDAAALAAPGLPRIQAFTGLALATLALPLPPDQQRAAEKSVASLSELILTEDIRPDGGVIERCPSVQLLVTEALLTVRAAYGLAQVTPPAALSLALDRCVPVLRFFCHGDGALALFNGGQEESATRIGRVLDVAGGGSKVPQGAPHSGFQRLERGKSVVLIDCGSAQNGGHSEHAPPGLYPLGGAPHAGTLSLEVSDGRERLIVNCGAHLAANPRWRKAQRATAAHSALTLAERSSSDFDADGQITRGPSHVSVSRDESADGVWLDLSHDGYIGPFGLLVQRRLFLASDGHDLRGEDRLVPGGGEMGYGIAPFVIRFHLHPSVTASLLQGGSAVLLRTKSGAGWRLRAAGASLGLSDSIYLGNGFDMNRSQQITLSGETDGAGATVKWALRREER
jgi:uncharacterized heparinase superfamily protein